MGYAEALECYRALMSALILDCSANASKKTGNFSVAGLLAV